MIEAVILYSTNDKRFFKPCIENLLEAGIKCHVVTYSHMWKGTPEDEQVLKESIEYFKNEEGVHNYRIEWEPGKDPWYWEAVGRYLATREVSSEAEYILYIDIDEIVSPEAFKKWLATEEYKQYDSMKLPNYWYFREPIYRATDLSDSIVMTKASLAKQLPLRAGGREAYFGSFTNRTRFKLKEPFIHHFSWVRTKEQMLAKVKNWGHAGDKSNWEELVEEEFSRPFNGKCFVNNREFTEVENSFNI
jgi:hypothetical protein